MFTLLQRIPVFHIWLNDQYFRGINCSYLVRTMDSTRFWGWPLGGGLEFLRIKVPPSMLAKHHFPLMDGKENPIPPKIDLPNIPKKKKRTRRKEGPSRCTIAINQSLQRKSIHHKTTKFSWDFSSCEPRNFKYHTCDLLKIENPQTNL